MARDDPVIPLNTLKLQEGLVQFRYVVESPHPEQVFFEGPRKTPGAIPSYDGLSAARLSRYVPNTPGLVRDRAPILIKKWVSQVKSEMTITALSRNLSNF